MVYPKRASEASKTFRNFFYETSRMMLRHQTWNTFKDFMPLELFTLPAFERSLKLLDAGQKKTVQLLFTALEIYLASDCDLNQAQKIAPRFFFKQLRKPFYEAGIEGKLRLIIRREKSKCFVLLVGNHDQVKRFLSYQ